MQWLVENWFWILVGIAFFAMHLFGHGHGGHAAAAAAAAAAKTTQVNPQVINIREGQDMLNTKLVSWALGIFAAVSFVVCVIFGLVTPQSLHMHAFLEQVLPGFKWLSLSGFALGLVESFLYGVYAGMVFSPIYNWLNRRFATG